MITVEQERMLRSKLAKLVFSFSLEIHTESQRDGIDPQKAHTRVYQKLTEAQAHDFRLVLAKGIQLNQSFTIWGTVENGEFSYNVKLLEYRQVLGQLAEVYIGLPSGEVLEGVVG